jgi:hypothetical protein
MRLLHTDESFFARQFKGNSELYSIYARNKAVGSSTVSHPEDKLRFLGIVEGSKAVDQILQHLNAARDNLLAANGIISNSRNARMKKGSKS